VEKPDFKTGNKILEEHKEFFETHATKSIDFRILQLNRLKKTVKKYEADILEALYKDLGKCKMESFMTEIGYILMSITQTAKKLKSWAKPQRVSTPFYLMPSKSYKIYEPYGTVLILGPFNYPFQLVLEPLIGAVAAGNCAVVKPSELTPNVSSILNKIIGEAFDKKYIRCIEGNSDVSAMLSSLKFDYIFFTGSESVGRKVMKAAAENLVPVTLELGGKSPVIVTDSAKLKTAAQRIIWGKLINCGQTCIAPDYILVDKKVKEKFIEQLKLAIKKFYGKDIRKNKDLAHIVNEKHFQRLENILKKDKEYIVFGGNCDKEVLFIEPAILDIKDINAACMQEEIFGPILPVLAYDDIQQAVNIIKGKAKPLALYIFNEKSKLNKKLLKEISSGGVCINDTINHIVNKNLPFGGVGKSGMGAYHGKYGFLTFSHCKSVFKKSTRVNVNFIFPPYNEKLLKYIKKIMK